MQLLQQGVVWLLVAECIFPQPEEHINECATAASIESEGESAGALNRVFCFLFGVYLALKVVRPEDGLFELRLLHQVQRQLAGGEAAAVALHLPCPQEYDSTAAQEKAAAAFQICARAAQSKTDVVPPQEEYLARCWERKQLPRAVLG